MLNEHGQEVPDPTPVSVPHNWQRPLSLQEEIRRLIRTQLSEQAAAAGEETFEEAEDFDVEDEDVLVSPYEIPEALPEAPGGVLDRDAAPPLDPKEKLVVESPGASEGPIQG